MSALTRIISLSKTTFRQSLALNSARLISTSKKKQETATISPSALETATKPAQTQNWMSYGFSDHDKNEDRHIMHLLMFTGVSVVLVFGGMLLAYRPDELGRDWAQREAYLELRRREKLGLPLIDPNYLPLDQINIPSDEELGDLEIVI